MKPPNQISFAFTDSPAARACRWGPLEAYPSAPLQNGVGRYVCQLKRLTFVFDKSRHDSFGVREFINNDLEEYATTHKGIVFYLLPRYSKAPYLMGEYLNGRTCGVHVSGDNREKICGWVNYLRTRSGNRIVQYRDVTRTQVSSIQGFWHPFLNIPTEMNVTEFPSKEFSELKPLEKSASEKILELSKALKELKNVKCTGEQA